MTTIDTTKLADVSGGFGTPPAAAAPRALPQPSPTATTTAATAAAASGARSTTFVTTVGSWFGWARKNSDGSN